MCVKYGTIYLFRTEINFTVVELAFILAMTLVIIGFQYGWTYRITAIVVSNNFYGRMGVKSGLCWTNYNGILWAN